MEQRNISAVLIAKDEEALIRRCIRSLAGVDEVVVLDTGSTDRTVDIAREAGANVFSIDPIVPFHFAEARNRATAHATHPWVLSIDADEVLRAGSLRKLRKAIADADEKTTAFSTLFVNRPEGGDHSIAIHKIKVFRKDAWTWKYRVHEQLVETMPGVVAPLEAVVLEHLPEPDKARRHGQNIELLRLCIQENPEYARAFRHLGQELMLRKEWDEAVPRLLAYLEKTDEGPIEISYTFANVGECRASAGQLDEALGWFNRAAEAHQDRREPLFQAAWWLIKSCRLDEALVWIDRMLAIPASRRPFSNVDVPKAWSGEPLRMLTFCREEIARAKASWEAQQKTEASGT